MNNADFPDDSDTSDEDYAPDNGNTELPSEEESDGDCEDVIPEAGEELRTRGSKRRKAKSKSKKKLKTITNVTPKDNKDKEKTEDLWASFKQDTGFKTRAERSQTNKIPHLNSLKQTSLAKTDNSNDKIKVTQIFNFAGEEVEIEKEVSKNSNEFKMLNVPSGSKVPKARGGLNSVLNQIGKKPKISTLEKSKLDWDRFKKEEKIEDELSAYGKSKDGYLEKQDFLQRADLRRFEIEKDIRASLKTNRMNNMNM